MSHNERPFPMLENILGVVDDLQCAVEATRDAAEALRDMADEIRAALDLSRGDPAAQVDYLRGVYNAWKQAPIAQGDESAAGVLDK